MKISITKGQTSDRIEARRPDGSAVCIDFPHKGTIPHDAVHFFVESELGIGDGFWGLVDRGRHPEEIQDLAKAAGHASASRAEQPDADFVPVIQAERIVECFEADLWSGGGGDNDSFRHMAQAGCEQSLIPEFPLTDATIDLVREKIAAFRDEWIALPVGGSVELDWREHRAAE